MIFELALVVVTASPQNVRPICFPDRAPADRACPCEEKEHAGAAVLHCYNLPAVGLFPRNDDSAPEMADVVKEALIVDKRFPKRLRFIVEGRATPDEQSPDKLAEHRARRVRDMLIAAGIPSTRIVVQSRVMDSLPIGKTGQDFSRAVWLRFAGDTTEAGVFFP